MFNGVYSVAFPIGNVTFGVFVTVITKLPITYLVAPHAGFVVIPGANVKTLLPV
ncbi:hypothetical protein SDC9_107018 [bioreactor metagenome]|uniref:Uncharacterized protein n=1 Tax=bioreactor metagenome TaxID=1076179 RepID=A0A645B3X3_9ZZZZ